jgi:hypothetical protein
LMVQVRLCCLRCAHHCTSSKSIRQHHHGGSHAAVVARGRRCWHACLTRCILSDAAQQFVCAFITCSVHWRVHQSVGCVHLATSMQSAHLATLAVSMLQGRGLHLATVYNISFPLCYL